jgi:DNA polymerase-1
MQYLYFGTEERSTYKVCILVNDIRKEDIEKAYIKPFNLNVYDVIVISLYQKPGSKKTPATEQKAYLNDELLPVLKDLQTEYLIVGDGDYFKTITGITKVDSVLGYVLDSKFGNFKTVYVPNYRTVFYDPPKIKEKIALGINALKSWIDGSYIAPGVDIIQFCAYPRTAEEVAQALEHLMSYPALTCDIEAFSLKHYSAGIGTISFAWSQSEGVAFAVDLNEYGHGPVIRDMLRIFFENYTGKLIYHHIAYDVYVLIYQLFMKHILDNEGLLYGLSVMLKNWDDTKLIAYLATNSCAGNKLSLKSLAQSYAGDYAQEDIKDIRKIPLPQLLQYNLVDTLSTWFVYNRFWDRMVSDNQLPVYNDVFKPATVDIIQMQLTGMPVDMNRVIEVKALLQQDNDTALAIIQNNPLLQSFIYHLKEEHVRKRNEKLKTKQISIDDAEVNEIIFNPNSDPQLQSFLYEHLNLPIIAKTQSKQPSTSGDTLKSLLNHTDNPLIKEFLNALIDFKSVDKILTSFIPAMEYAQKGIDGWHYLFGNFNL